ncbi:heterokaryon incompatibility protein-domain-containing protein [Phyllosticta capitalensis]
MDTDSTDSWDDSVEDASSDVWDDSIWNDAVNAVDSADEMKKRRKFLRGDPPTVNWEALQSKLSNVTTDRNPSPVPPWLRVIDVDQRKVVRAPSEPFDYVCLSYTWGEVQEFQATADTIFKLEEDGALDKPENPDEPEGPDNPRVPATIRDAMTVCRHLGQKYLWVDRICIVQDGPERQLHFDEMGLIFNDALVTLVAFEGRNARYGLHGISKPFDLNAPDIDFWTRSEWPKRGWTYQEAILSRRMILFAVDGVVLEHEGEAALTQKYEGPDHHLYLPMFHGAIDYYFSVENYTKRKLGQQSDIVNAFSGICRYLFDKDHQFGIPMNDFDNAMHWIVQDTERKERPVVHPNIFPSWSWTSIKGSTVFPQVLPVLAVASWALVDSNSGLDVSLKCLKPKDFAFSAPQDGKHPALVELAFKSLVHDRMLVKQVDERFEKPERIFLNLEPGPYISSSVLGSEMSLEKFTSEFPSYSKFWDFCRGIGPDSEGPPPFFKEFSMTQIKLASEPGRILAHSWASILQVRSSLKRGDFHIVNREPVGFGYFDDPSYLLEPRRAREQGPRPSPFTFTFFALAISSITDWETLRILLPPEIAERRLFSSELLNTFEDGEDGPRNRVLSVLAVDEDPTEPGVFHRVGFGFINFKKWLDRLNRFRSTIVLS